MSDIARQLDERLKQAMKARDQRTADLIRMVKTRMMERRTAKGFSGEVDDALWLEVISAYVKTLEKGIAEFEKIDSDSAREQADALRWETTQLAAFLPAKADEATTRGWVDEVIAGLGGKEKAKVGAVVGAVMKSHKGDADAAMVRRLTEAALA